MSIFLVNLLKIILIPDLILCLHIPVITENAQMSNEAPQETQHAVCKVYTKEIEASAKATITRQLKGVCSSKDLSVRFEDLKDTILMELQDIKLALGIQVESRLKNLNPTTTSTTTTIEPAVYEYQDYPDLELDPVKTIIQTKNLKYHNDNMSLIDEILLNNDTMVDSSNEGELYYYYWKISNIRKVLKKRDMYVSSPSFSILGHTLYLHLYPNYMNEYLGVLLKPDSNSFLKKHKIIFLGQTSTQNQISSRTLYGVKNDEKIFKIDPQMLDDNFIVQDSLVIKVKIYLNS